MSNTALNNSIIKLEKTFSEKNINTFGRKLTLAEMQATLSFETEKFKITGVGEARELHELAFKSKFYRENYHVCSNRHLYDIPEWISYSPSALIFKLDGAEWINSDSGDWTSGDKKIRCTIFVTLDIKDGYKSHDYNKK